MSSRWLHDVSRHNGEEKSSSFFFRILNNSVYEGERYTMKILDLLVKAISAIFVAIGGFLVCFMILVIIILSNIF